MDAPALPEESSFILLILFQEDKKGDLYAYLPFALWVPINASFMVVDLHSFVTNLLSIPMEITYVLVLFKLFVYDKYKSRIKIPFINDGASAAIYTLVISFVILLFGGLTRLHRILGEILSQFSHPLGVGIVNPVTETIAEYGGLDPTKSG